LGDLAPASCGEVLASPGRGQSGPNFIHSTP